MVKSAIPIVALAFGLTVAADQPASAQQTAASSRQDLRQRIVRRYEVLPLRNGVLLRSRSQRPVRSIELSENKIAINGVEVTGPELRQQLGPDSDLVLELSYLELSAQRSLLGFDSQPDVSATPDLSRPGSDRLNERRNRRAGIVRFGGDVTVGPDEMVTDDVVVFGGTARIDGQVNGDVVVLGGRVELGPKAYVTREVTVVGGTLQRDPDAVVDGEITEVGGPGWVFDRNRFRDRRGRFAGLWPKTGFFSLVATSLRAAVLIVLASILLVVAHRPIERIATRAVAEPLKAGLVGFFAELLFVPTLIATVILLAISIVGIPLLLLVPFAILALIVILLMGFSAVATRVGERVAARFGWPQRNRYLLTVLGVVILLTPLLLARIVGVAGGGLTFVTIPLAIIGFFVEYLAWTIGLGAAALARFRPEPTSISAQTA